MMITFLLCHMLGVSSSCTNPILYGFLNDNFVKAGANNRAVNEPKFNSARRQCLYRFLNMKAQVGTFNKETALV